MRGGDIRKMKQLVMLGVCMPSSSCKDETKTCVVVILKIVPELGRGNVHTKIKIVVKVQSLIDVFCLLLLLPGVLPTCVCEYDYRLYLQVTSTPFPLPVW